MGTLFMSWGLLSILTEQCSNLWYADLIFFLVARNPELIWRQRLKGDWARDCTPNVSSLTVRQARWASKTSFSSLSYPKKMYQGTDYNVIQFTPVTCYDFRRPDGPGFVWLLVSSLYSFDLVSCLRIWILQRWIFVTSFVFLLFLGCLVFGFGYYSVGLL